MITTDTTGTDPVATPDPPIAPATPKQKLPRKTAKKSKVKPLPKVKSKKPTPTKRRSAASKAKKSVKARKNTGVRAGYRALPVLFKGPAVAAMDRSFKKIGLSSRMELFRQALHGFFIKHGERKTALHFVIAAHSPKGKVQSKSRSRRT